MHQVATLSVEVGLGSTLVDWYRDATSVPFGHLMIALSPRTDDRLRYCTNSGTIPSKYSVTDNLKHSKYLDDGHTKCLYLQAFQHFSLAREIQFLKTCPKEFIRLLSECNVNLLPEKLSEVKRSHVLKYRDKNHELSLKRTTWKQRRSLLSVQKGFLLIKTISLSSLIVCLEMEKFVLVPLSAYNSSNNRTVVTKQELSKYKPEQTPTYHKHTLKNEYNQQLSTTASPLVNKILESPRIKLSNSNNLILDGIETGVLLKDFAQRLKRKIVTIADIFILLYLTQPASLPTLLSTVIQRVKKEGLGSLSKPERQKLQRIYTQGFAAYGSVRNLAKAAKLSPSKVREFLHSKTS